jgi:DNA-binding FrmR family transcriptional regulator
MVPATRGGEYPRVEGQILHNLRRVEGQLRGVQRMVIEGRACEDIVAQLRAIEGSVDRIAQRVLEPYIRDAIAEARGEQSDEQVRTTLLPVLHNAIHR